MPRNIQNKFEYHFWFYQKETFVKKVRTLTEFSSSYLIKNANEILRLVFGETQQNFESFATSAVFYNSLK